MWILSNLRLEQNGSHFADNIFRYVFLIKISVSIKISMKFVFQVPIDMWQTGLNLSGGIRWCLALASVRQLWCLLWHVWCVCMCVCRVNGGPDLVCVMEACSIRVICVNCGIETLGFIKCYASVVPAMFAPVVCCDLIRVPLWWCQFLSGLLISWLFLWCLKLCGFISRRS